MKQMIISGLSRQIGAVSNKISSLCDEISFAEAADMSELKELYETLIMDEVGHMQALTLELTNQITGVANADDSAFFAGELTSNIGEKKTKHPGEGGEE